MHIFIFLWNRNLTGSKLTSPFGFFRHLQQEEILTKALLYRCMFSPKLKDDSQYEEALHTPRGRQWRVRVDEGLALRGAALLASTRLALRPLVLQGCSWRCRPGGPVLCALARQESGACQETLTQHLTLTCLGPFVKVIWGCQNTGVPPFTWLWKVCFLHLFSIQFSVLQLDPDSKSSG